MRLALAGDTMLGRGVAAALASRPSPALVAPEIAEATREADLCVLNLECCISERGEPWPAASRSSSGRRPPRPRRSPISASTASRWPTTTRSTSVRRALLDTLEHLGQVGIACVGAGRRASSRLARRPCSTRGVALARRRRHRPSAGYAAAPDRPGVAFADLSRGAPDWLLESSPRHAHADVVARHAPLGPEHGPGAAAARARAAAALVEAGATLVAGHSAHVFHGVAGRVLYDLGDFVDDYAVDPVLRNDLGLLWLVDVEAGGPARLELVPLKLEYCHTRPATGEDAAWIRRRFRAACEALGTEVTEEGGRLVICPG